MILSGDERVLVGYGNPNIPGVIWYCDTETETSDFVRVGDSYVSVIRSENSEFFIVYQSISGGRFELSLRPYSNVSNILARLNYDNNEIVISGDRSLAFDFPSVMLHDDHDDAVLLIFNIEDLSVERQALPWFDNTYDHDYQVPCGAMRIPNSNLVIVSVARDSNPVIHNLETGEAVRKLTLANRYGNPSFRFRKTAPEVWVSDGDTLLRLDMTEFRVLDSLLLQPEITYAQAFGEIVPVGPDRANLPARGFIGEWKFNHDEKLCVVARPYSRDVVLLDTATFKVTHRAAVPRRPAGEDPYEPRNLGRGADEVALLSDGRAIARVIHARDVTVIREWEPYTFP